MLLSSVLLTGATEVSPILADDEMRMIRILLAFAVLTGAGGGLSVARAADQELKAEDAIAQVLADYGTAWNNGDGQAIAELFTTDADDAVIGSVARGRSQIEKRYTQLLNETFRGTQISLDMSALRFLTPAVAMVDGSFQLNGVSGSGDAKVKRLVLAVIVKDNDQWRITSLWSAATTPTDSTR